jgi:predicted nuclease with TOPRIM domain
MQIDATLLLAIGGIITGILAFISSRAVDKRAAHRDEISLLRDEVSRLQERVEQLTSANENWRTKYDNLYSCVLMLRKILVDHNIDVPEMSAFGDPVHPDAIAHPEKKAKEKKLNL